MADPLATHQKVGIALRRDVIHSAGMRQASHDAARVSDTSFVGKQYGEGDRLADGEFVGSARFLWIGLGERAPDTRRFLRTRRVIDIDTVTKCSKHDDISNWV